MFYCNNVCTIVNAASTLPTWFGPISIKFSTGDVHKNLLRECIFHKNWYSESSTLLTGINVCLSVLSTLIGLGKIQYEWLANIVLFNICEFPENWHGKGHTYGCKLNYIYAYTVKPYDILKVNNALVNLWTTSWSIPFANLLFKEPN